MDNDHGTTGELRAMLDERGVEYETADNYRCKFTLWRNNEIDAGWDDSENWEQPHLLIIGFTPEQAVEATLGRGTCREVYLLMATDIGDGREEVLGVYATEEAAIAAINENQFGYALHHVRKWVVDE